MWPRMINLESLEERAMAQINGAVGADVLAGTASPDTITGGRGVDTLTGGGGADTFVFAAGDGGNTEPHDVITDFRVGEDRLQVAGGITGTERASNGTYVHYATNSLWDTNWVLLRDVSNPDIAKLTNPGAGGVDSGGNAPPPAVGSGPSAGNDRINGTSGADRIEAGRGADTMTGGGGADQFVFSIGDGGANEPHDTITDFEVGVDRLVVPGGITGTERVSTGTYVHYGTPNLGDTNWVLLQGVVNPNLARLTDPGAASGGSGGGGTAVPNPPAAPVGGGNLPTHRVVYDEDFAGNLGRFTNLWGVVDRTPDGAIELTSRAGTWNDSGLMMQSADSFGYGLYEFTLRVNKPEPGGYALTWPANNVWPGPELDVVEFFSGGEPYGTIHWRGGDGSNQYQAYGFGRDIDPRQTHTYAMNWQRGYIDFYVDGRFEVRATEHVPLSAADGGLNATPGFGVQTWWNVDRQGGTDYVLIAEHFSYSVVG
ncbi:hypothetical protein CKO45_16690 [Paracraurococcus ruber]|uniref:GH16 domain-containing protein n=2 Tax=Paracraurococcus ruber TaxID=77675 RepID=A0ABS1CZW2_9PROT|nr:hypothetical protein [Paracraurococcus ruber]